MGLSEELEQISTKMLASTDVAEQASYLIWGAAVTTTRAFNQVTLKIDANHRKIYVGITLHWWARLKSLEKIRQIWLLKAEANCKKQMQEGWRGVFYYSDNK